MGGHDGTNYTSDLLLFNLGEVSWCRSVPYNDANFITAVSLQYEPRPSAGKPPSPRGYHVTLLADSRLFVFGGFNGHDVGTLIMFCSCLTDCRVAACAGVR